MSVPSVPRKSVLLFSANQVPTTASCGVLRERKKTLDNSAHFLNTDKRHIRVFQKKGERNLKGDGGETVVGWEEKETRRERSFSIHSPNEFLLSRTDDYGNPTRSKCYQLCGGRTSSVPCVRRLTF